MITEELKQVTHNIDRVIVKKHDVTAQFLCKIGGANGELLTVFKLIDRGATGEVESMPYEMLRGVQCKRPAPMNRNRRPTDEEMAHIKERCHPCINEEDEKKIFVGTFDNPKANFYNANGTLIASINSEDEIEVIVKLFGGVTVIKGAITFDHLMDSFELPVMNPWFQN